VKLIAGCVLAAQQASMYSAVHVGLVLAAALRAISLTSRYVGWLMLCSRGGLGPQPGGVLEDALGTGVMKKLLSTDQALGHGHLAPGAEPVGEAFHAFM
jgi:hypothetical protein